MIKLLFAGSSWSATLINLCHILSC